MTPRPKGGNWELIGPTKSVFEKGGSLGVCIPSRITSFLQLRAGDQLLFVLDKKNRRMIVGKKESFQVKVGRRVVAFYAPISKDDVKSVLEAMREHE
jgi:antitoxin component of MazEF toxin-antitoxin module